MELFKTGCTFQMYKQKWTFTLLTLLLFTLALFSLSWGRFPIPIENVLQTLMGNNPNDMQNNIIFNLRLPRIFAAILVGAALSVAGGRLFKAFSVIRWSRLIYLACQAVLVLARRWRFCSG